MVRDNGIQKGAKGVNNETRSTQGNPGGLGCRMGAETHCKCEPKRFATDCR